MTATALLLWVLLAAGPPGEPADDPHAARLTALLERVARGTPDEAQRAAEALAREVAGPLAAALARIAPQDAAQQARLQDALRGVWAELRWQIFCLGLPAEDRRRAEKFLELYPHLRRQLFSEDPRQRIAGVEQVPLVRDSGAGVLLLACVDDVDAEVAQRALRRCAELADTVVARGLTRYVQDVIAAMRAGVYGPAQQDIEIVLTDFVRQAIPVIARAGYRPATPVLVDAVRFLGRGRWRMILRVEEALAALGALGDPRASELLLEYLADPTVIRSRTLPDERRVTCTIGDVALAALLRIWELHPAAVGLYTDPAAPLFCGFPDERSRRRAVEAFRAWYRANAALPPAQRAPLTTRPAGDD